MKPSFTKANIFQLISSLEGYDRKEILEEGVAYKLKLSHTQKMVEVTWPYELGEVFLDFYEDNQIIFQDWFECLESDEVNDFIEYIEEVTKRFLFNNSRVHKKGFLIKTNELQYLNNDEWLDVFHP